MIRSILIRGPELPRQIIFFLSTTDGLKAFDERHSDYLKRYFKGYIPREQFESCHPRIHHTASDLQFVVQSQALLFAPILDLSFVDILSQNLFYADQVWLAGLCTQFVTSSRLNFRDVLLQFS